VGNQVVASTHENRTILELVQNARDAIREGDDDSESKVAVIVGPESLLIANTGRPFELHDEEVFEAVTGLGRSGKVEERGSIGEKGVGLKSLLQLSEQFSVHSVVNEERVATKFTREHTGRMLLEAYQVYLKNPELRDEFESETLDKYQEVLADVLADRPESELSPALDSEAITTTEIDTSEEPPDPESVLTDLPRLSLFRYPFPLSQIETETTASGRLIDALLTDAESDDSEIETTNGEWLSTHAGKYQTVVKLEYSDLPWTQLLDDVRESLSASVPDAVEAFDTKRQGATVGPPVNSEERQKQFWTECTDLSASTLVLLGELEEIDFLKLEEVEDGFSIVDSREVTISRTDEEATRVSRDPDLVRTPFSVNEVFNQQTESDTEFYNRTFRRYTQTLDPRNHSWLTDEDRDTDSDLEAMHLLVEHPRPDDEDWEPAPKPLHLFYPISDATTPFPFVIHGPFEVSFDRQHLAEDSKNKALIDELDELVTTVGTDLVNGDNESSTTGTESYRSWMPWLLAPLASPDSDTGEPLARGIKATLRALEDTIVVPTDGGGSIEPVETLLDPARLTAFEVLRQRDTEVPIPEAPSIMHGQKWKSAIPEARTDDGNRFREFLSQIGLTTIIDTISEDAPETDLVSVLCNVWETASSDTTLSETFDNWHVDVEVEEHATEYFEAVTSALARHGGPDVESSGTESEAAARLGQQGIPLLPAEMHHTQGIDDQSTPRGEVSRLVRAWPSKGQQEGGQQQRSERIVFRRDDSKESQQDIQQLPTPPEELPVYIIPYHDNWVGPLTRHNRRWGTRELEGQADFYRRVGAEAGGFTARPIGKPAVLGYLIELYKQSTARQPADWATPTPFHNRRFEDVEDMFAGDTLTSTPQDYDSFLERRYLQTVPLPVVGGDTKPAERLVFGPEWAERFKSVAAALERDETDYLFEQSSDDVDAEPAAQFRRWAAAIECRREFTTDRTSTLAPPSDDWWERLQAHTDLSGAIRERWELYFLLHLGVQVGPRIEWGWLFPGRGTDDRRAGALSLKEVRNLADASPEFDDSPPISPSGELLGCYQDICWRSENHPAFSASHSGSCREGWLDCDIDTWTENDDLAIPTWWHFTELNASHDRGHRVALRDAILLVWPELADTIADTAWYCDGTYYSHQVGTHKYTIPALGIVQLREASIWPIEDPKSENSDAEDVIDISSEQLHPSTYLVTEQGSLGAARYLPRLDFDTITERLADRLPGEFDAWNLTIASVPAKLGASSLDELTAAQAADRLCEFLERRSHADSPRTQAHDAVAPVQSTWDSRPNTEPTYGLMRRLAATDHVGRKVTDEELQRQWLRCDLWHVGVRLPLRWAGDSLVLDVSRDNDRFDAADLRIYTRQLPQYARARFETDEEVAIIERPTPAARAIAALLGGVNNEGTRPPFGIRMETAVPELNVANGESRGTEEERDAIDELRTELDDRLTYLLAGYVEHTSEPKHLEVYEQLSEVIQNQIGIVEHTGVQNSRHSAQWSPPNSTNEDPNQIAIYRSAIEEHSDDETAIPSYLTADGLTQVIGQYDLRNVFENILIKPLNAIKYDYEDQVQQVRGELVELQEQRFVRVQEALRTLLSTVDAGVSPPEITLGDDYDVEATLSAMGDPTTDPTDAVVSEWIETFQAAGLEPTTARYCIAAAAIEDLHSRQQTMATAFRTSSHLGREDLGGHPIWSDLENWPTGQHSDGIRTYLTAVRKAEAFCETLTSTESAGEDAIRLAVDAANSAGSIPEPLTTVQSALPYGNRLPPELGEQFLIEITDGTKTDVPEPILSRIEEWYHDQRTAITSDPIYRDAEFTQLLDDLSEGLSRPTGALEAVEEAFYDYADWTDSGTTRVSQAKRREKTMQWVSDQDSDLERAIETALTAKDAPEEGNSPSINDTSSGTPRANAEIADDRGRDAELLCLAQTWDRFRQLEQTIRDQILDELEHWRSYEPWRMTPVDDLATTASDGSDATETSPADRLRARSLSDTPDLRAAFRTLFDTSSENGPGFDYIDPFGDAVETSPWQPSQMRRVEVKAITPEYADSGRVKLTGNEFRMARRRGPTPTRGTLDKESQEPTDRYLLRLVSLPRDWRTGGDQSRTIELRDIHDFVEYGGFDTSDEPLWEKLRIILRQLRSRIVNIKFWSFRRLSSMLRFAGWCRVGNRPY